MNVLVVSQYFWPEAFRINDLVQGLIERGHKVTVLTGKPNYPEGRFFPGYRLLGLQNEGYRGAEVVRVPLIPRGSGSRAELVCNYLSFALFASFLGPLLCRDEYDLILVFEPSPITVGLPAIVMKRLKRAPIMFWVQDLWPESLSATGAINSKRALGLVAKLVRYIYRRCDRILVTSKGFVQRVEALGAKAAKVRYWPQWAETVYRPVTLPNEAPEKKEMPPGFNVLFAGNIGAAQSFDTIITAADKLRDYEDIHWVVVGDGRMKPQVQKLADRLSLNERVHFLGKRPVESMPRYFSLADALLVTLRKDYIFSLTVPGKMQSYLACGRPVVASLDGEGARVVEEAQCGATARAEDADALARAVLDLYETKPAEREQMGLRARAYFEEHFERERLLDRFESWMEELVGNGR